MRIRSIKPEFWEDEDVANLAPSARLFFIGLWNLADDGGYLRWSVTEVGAALYRFEPRGRRERNVTAFMDVLTEAGMVRILDCGRHALVPNLPKHQRLSGEAKQVHTFGREHDSCSAETVLAAVATIPEDPRRSPQVPAGKRGEAIPATPRRSPRKARTSPLSRAPEGGEVSPSEMVMGGSEGGAGETSAAVTVEPVATKRDAAGTSSLNIPDTDPRYPVAKVLAGRFRFHQATEAQWDRLYEVVDQEYPSGTKKGADPTAGWRWLAELLTGLKRNAGDPIEAAFRTAARFRAERLAKADEAEAAWQDVRAQPATHPGLATGAKQLAARVTPKPNGKVTVERRAQAMVFLRESRGLIGEPMWSEMLTRYGLTEADLDAAG